MAETEEPVTPEDATRRLLELAERLGSVLAEGTADFRACVYETSLYVRWIGEEMQAAPSQAGWRPPLPADDPLSREQLGEKVREVATAWSLEDDDRPGRGIQTWEQLEPDLQEMYMRCGEALFNLGRASIEPLPADEVETAVDVFGYDGRFLYAGTLQPRRNGGWDVFHHTDRRHIAAAPVEPKETP